MDKSTLMTRSGIAVLVLGTGPLVAYCIFGPKDGNPIGLGLLFVATVPFALGLLMAGRAGRFFGSLGREARTPEQSLARPRSRPRPPRSGDDWP